MRTEPEGKLTNAPCLSGVTIGSRQEKPTVVSGRSKREGLGEGDGLCSATGDGLAIAEGVAMCLAIGWAAWLHAITRIASKTGSLLTVG